jgi:hypothetical protein
MTLSQDEETSDDRTCEALVTLRLMRDSRLVIELIHCDAKSVKNGFNLGLVYLRIRPASITVFFVGSRPWTGLMAVPGMADRRASLLRIK